MNADHERCPTNSRRAFVTSRGEAGRGIPVRDASMAFSGLEKRLAPDRFALIHRSAIVQVDRIRELHPASHGDMDLVLRDGTVLTLSRTWRHQVTDLFGGLGGR